MTNKGTKILHQPLLHFLLIGALLFALYYIIHPAQTDKEIIVINDEQVDRIEMIFEKEWNRPPHEEELKGLLERYVQQEVYYRKALRMNLDKNDEIIRRRLEQKLLFVTSDMANLANPSMDSLMTFYKAHKAKYMEPKKYSFSHIYFNADKRAHAKEDAVNVLATLKNSDQDMEALIKKGDAFAFAYHVDSLTQKDIDGEMGETFSEELDKLPLHQWAGPVLSGYGTHLVFIDAVKEATEKDFTLIKEDVLRDFRYNMQQVYNKEMYETFKKEYTIELNIKNPKRNKQQLKKMVAANDL